MGTYNHFIFGYVGNYFDIIVNRTHNIIIHVGIKLGRLTNRIEAMPFGGASCPDGVNDWAMLQHVLALSGKGGSDVTGLNTGLRLGPARPKERPWPSRPGPRCPGCTQQGWGDGSRGAVGLFPPRRVRNRLE